MPFIDTRDRTRLFYTGGGSGANGQSVGVYVIARCGVSTLRPPAALLYEHQPSPEDVT